MKSKDIRPFQSIPSLQWDFCLYICFPQIPCIFCWCENSRHEGYLAKIEREEREKALKGERNDQLEPKIASEITLQLPMIQYGCPKLMQFLGQLHSLKSNGEGAWK